MPNTSPKEWVKKSAAKQGQDLEILAIKYAKKPEEIAEKIAGLQKRVARVLEFLGITDTASVETLAAIRRLVKHVLESKISKPADQEDIERFIDPVSDIFAQIDVANKKLERASDAKPMTGDQTTKDPVEAAKAVEPDDDADFDFDPDPIPKFELGDLPKIDTGK